jgi:hypothetical protein
MDAFAQPRCPLCALLSQYEGTLISAFLGSPDPAKKSKISLEALCAVHKIRIKKIGAGEPSLPVMVKMAVRDSLRELQPPRKDSKPPWLGWWAPFRGGCPLCRQFSARERDLSRALIRFLDDTDFWKGFQRGRLLCSDHLGKFLGVAGKGVGFERLQNDQRAKLNALLDDLVRFEATGTHGECISTALAWLADFAGPPFDADEADASFAKWNLAPKMNSDAHSDSLSEGAQDLEQLLFENEKLTRKVRDLLDRLNDVETRAASLHYEAAKLSADNKRLQMGYTGAHAQADGLNQLVEDLRGRIDQLKVGGAAPRAKSAS